MKAQYASILLLYSVHEGVSKSFRTGRLERKLEMVQLRHFVQLYHYFVSQSSEFCHHKPLCCFSTSLLLLLLLLLLLFISLSLSPETFGYTLVEAFIKTNAVLYVFQN